MKHKPYTDKYFLRSRQILKKENINPIVRYQIFARAEGLTRGIDEAVEFIKDKTKGKVRIYALKDNTPFESKEPLIKLEGRVQDLIELETVYLGIVSGGLTGPIDLELVREKARAIKQTAQDKPVIYFGARHFHYNLDQQIAQICQEEGFVGTSTDIGAKAWNKKGIGTIPHALILSYAAHMDENNIKGNPTVEAAKGFDKYISKKVPRIVLIDTFNREISDTLETAQALPSLAGVRIDTCGENHSQYLDLVLPQLDVKEKYLKGKGVTIEGVWSLRKAMVENNLGHLDLVVSSGFNEKKTAAFMQADKVFQEEYGFPLFTSIGTGSIAKPKMATSDIVAYFNEKEQKWKPMSKIGRNERETNRLEEV